MDIISAKKICRDFYGKPDPTNEESFMFVEALSFLIDKTKKPEYMTELGAYYYGIKKFDLALKYYELAAEGGDLYAILDLGYIWYYGRTGTKDYEKAFHYFDKASSMGNINAAYKVADMYRNGYFVKKDIRKYEEIIEGLYDKIKGATDLDDPLPEIYTRLAKIRSESGKIEEALRLYFVARDFLSQRIAYNPFFGNLTIMKYLIYDWYTLVPFDESAFSLYDLYYLFRNPAKVSFSFENKEYEAEALEENGEMVIKYGDTWFRTVDDFFAKGKIGDELLISLNEELREFEVI